jgi:ATP-dependent exoDNAse (exonuclease V) alpha subunit
MTSQSAAKKSTSFNFSPQGKEALRLMENTSESIFLTGRAGTGKSTLLRYFCDHTKKNVVVLAPTGVAAINAHGQTIHSFFGFKPNITLSKVKKVDNPELYEKLDTIVIDEISMVRADLMDCIDRFLRLNGPTGNAPFGGVQMIFVGDLYQLPPIVTDQEREVFHRHYDTPYFFSARALSVLGGLSFATIELTNLYRQRDSDFINILNGLRTGTITGEQLQLLNTRYNPDFFVATEEFPIYLTTTNARASSINEQQLSMVGGESQQFIGALKGEFDRNSLPTEEVLKLKPGAQIMLLTNDTAGRWVNGTVGVVLGFEDSTEGGPKAIVVEREGGEILQVLPHQWDMFEYYLDPSAQAVESKSIGSFTQYPLKLAWALTIHKSQGKTFDRMVLDLSRGTFAHGQLYVALSRCRTLAGITLTQPVQVSHIKLDQTVVRFMGSLSISST